MCVQKKRIKQVTCNNNSNPGKRKEWTISAKGFQESAKNFRAWPLGCEEQISAWWSQQGAELYQAEGLRVLCHVSLAARWVLH